MRIPPYWARAEHAGMNREGKEQTFWAWGWSFENLIAAKRDAAARAKRIFDHLVNGTQPDSYDYLERPFREEIVDSLTDGEDEIALITRNRYGALVLNSASVCFVDVDFPQIQSHGFIDALLLFFSGRRRRQRMQVTRDATIQTIRDWAQRNPNRSFRLYRTRAGLRLLFTDRLYSPTSAETARMLKDLGSDSLYLKLTEKQECFRARLTPKPWRCGCRKPPNQYPWDNAEAERTYRHWEQEYREKTRGYTTCELVETIGEGVSERSVNAIVDLHDRSACGDPGSALA
jgi:hypothetical protein